MKITETFKIRRYWLADNTPQEVLDTLNWRYGAWEKARYVDINFWGEGDRLLTLMELKCAEWIISREEISYTVEGDDGLGD